MWVQSLLEIDALDYGSGVFSYPVTFLFSPVFPSPSNHWRTRPRVSALLPNMCLAVPYSPPPTFREQLRRPITPDTQSAKCLSLVPHSACLGILRSVPPAFLNKLRAGRCHYATEPTVEPNHRHGVAVVLFITEPASFGRSVALVHAQTIARLGVVLPKSQSLAGALSLCFSACQDKDI